MGDEMLASVCELAFDVAKEGSAPSAMKAYLYLAQRPPRAYSVAQRALEEDEGFRQRVAERATIEGVGEAGYLWLHRPAGWEQRFAALDEGVDPIDGAPGIETPLAQRPPMPAPPTISEDPAPSQPTPSTLIPSAEEAAPQPAPEAAPPVAAPRVAATPSPTVASIEDELSNLRGLVDRLADERQNVRSSVSELELELETRRAENLEMSTQLNSLRTELSTVQSTESTLLLERDRAFARITELEADVARLSADVERMAAEAEGSSSEHAAALTDLAVITSERDSARSEVDSLKADHELRLVDIETLRAENAEAASAREVLQSDLDAVRADLAELVKERDSLRGELEAVTTDRNGLTAQFNEIRLERDSIREELTSTASELDEFRSERAQLADQLAATNGERDELQGLLASGQSEQGELRARLDAAIADNDDLTRRLAVAEQARVDLEQQLEDASEKWKASARQLSVFENVNNQLDTAAAERDEAQDQLFRANEALADLRGRIGTSHDHIRQELEAVESAFGEGPLDVEAVAAAEDVLNDSAAVVTVIDGPGALQAANSPRMDTAEADALDIETAELDTFSDAAPEVGALDLEAPGFETPSVDAADLAVPDVDLPDIQTPEFDAPDLTTGAIEGLEAPSFADSVDFSNPEAPEIDAELSDDQGLFDGQGLELDPATLGGRTIGDMFGDNALADDEVSDLDPIGAPEVETVAETVAVSAGRRRLEISSDLDEKAYAHQVVNSPDVILLIDGDGAAGLGWPHLDVATRRSALIDYLGNLTGSTGAAADVVFSRPVGGEDALPVQRAVRVRIADHGVADSSIFSSIVEGYPEEWPIAVVSNEPAVLAQADALQVTVLSNDQLLDIFLDLNGGQ